MLAANAARWIGGAEQPHRRLVSAALLEIGDLDEHFNIGGFTLGEEAGVAFGPWSGVERTADEGDPPVPIVDQQSGRGRGTAGVVDQHGVGVARIRQRAVDEDDRDAELGERLRRLGVVTGRRQQEAVDTVADRRQHTVLPSRALVRIAQDELIARALGHRLGTLDHPGEERVGDVGDDEPDRVGAP